MLLRAILEEEGIEVAGAAGGGIQGVFMADDLAPDVVLMDLRMPDMDGVQATRRIKAAHPDMQVIFLTFYGDRDWADSAEDVGAFCYLVKGCPPSMIVEMIRRAWGYQRHKEADPWPTAADSTGPRPAPEGSAGLASG